MIKYNCILFCLLLVVISSRLQGVYLESDEGVTLEFRSLNFNQEGFLIQNNKLTKIREKVRKSGNVCVFRCPKVSLDTLLLLQTIFDKIDRIQFNLEKDVQNLSPQNFVDLLNILVFLEADNVLDLVLWFCPLQKEDEVIALLQNEELIKKITFLKSFIILNIEGTHIPISGILARYFPLICKYFSILSKKNMTEDFDLISLSTSNLKWYENYEVYTIDIAFMPDFNFEFYEDFFKKFFDLIVNYKNGNENPKIIVTSLNTCGNEEFIRFVLFYLEFFEFLQDFISTEKILNQQKISGPSRRLCNVIDEFILTKNKETIALNYPNDYIRDVPTFVSPYDITIGRKKGQKGIIIKRHNTTEDKEIVHQKLEINQQEEIIQGEEEKAKGVVIPSQQFVVKTIEKIEPTTYEQQQVQGAISAQVQQAIIAQIQVQEPVLVNNRKSILIAIIGSLLTFAPLFIKKIKEGWSSPDLNSLLESNKALNDDAASVKLKEV